MGKIQALIEKDMMPKVLGAHSVDQKELNKLAAMVAKCGSTKNIQLKATQRERKLYTGPAVRKDEILIALFGTSSTFSVR